MRARCGLARRCSADGRAAAGKHAAEEWRAARLRSASGAAPARMGWLPPGVEAAFDRLPIYPRNWVSFFILGLINNFAYVVINSSADDLVVLFNKQNLVCAVGLLKDLTARRLASSCGATSSSASSPAVHAALLDCASPWDSCKHLLASRMVLLQPHFDHQRTLHSRHPWHCHVCLCQLLVRSELHRPHRHCFVARREVRRPLRSAPITPRRSVLLGYLKNYESELVGGWSSGTGMAGVAGAALYLLFSTLGFSLRHVRTHLSDLTLLPARNRFLYMLPSVLIYILAYVVALSLICTDCEGPDGSAAQFLCLRLQAHAPRHGHSDRD